ncbi:helix-turn-helix domain-containing protein [Dysgonomonas mossii]|uniref:helix-turn-helix domain-containing protein n=1 Tax=Dysgonomonas mossii TaxID=163665 RepID=UPI003993BC13
MKERRKNFLEDFYSEIEKDIILDPFYFESRIDKFLISVREIMVKDKAYRNSSLDRNFMVERLSINKNLFAKMFKESFGMSFRVFVNGLRLRESVKLLECSDFSIEDISKKVGFGTVRTFQRLFTAEYNMTPNDYRKKKRN